MEKKFAKMQVAPLVYLMQKILFRMTLFSFLLLSSSLLLYAAGNFQRFLDKSQALILREAIFMAITLFFFSALSIAATILDSAVSKFYSWKKAAAIAFYVLCGIFAAASGILCRGILSVSMHG